MGSLDQLSICVNTRSWLASVAARRSQARLLIVAGSLTVPLGCSAPPAPESAKSEVTANTSGGTPPATPTVELTTPASATAAPLPADTRVADACAKLCERKTQSCPSHRDEACRADCAGYEAKAKGCEAPIAAALTCQATAKDNPCSNFAVSACTDVFVKMQRCMRGEPEVAATTKETLPAGWQVVKDDLWGVSMTLPADAKLDPQAKSRTWKASADGADYEIIELPRPKKIDDQSLVKLVIGHVGVSCQKEMRLNGRVDRELVVFTRFETGCAKGSRLFGKVFVNAGHALSLLVRGSAPTAQREAFLEGIR